VPGGAVVPAAAVALGVSPSVLGGLLLLARVGVAAHVPRRHAAPEDHHVDRFPAQRLIGNIEGVQAWPQ